MPFPVTPRVVYRENPLQEVVCQLDYPTILKITTELPADFQDRIRRKYPEFEQESLIPDGVAQLVRQFNIPLNEGARYKFLTDDRGRSINLGPESVFVSETDYRKWDVFKQEILLMRRALEDTYQPLSSYHRVGLRYINVVNKAQVGLAEEPWNKLLNPELISLLGVDPIGQCLESIKTEASIEIADIPGARATLRHSFSASEEEQQKYLIDVDVYISERTETNATIPILDSFNRTIGNLFRWAIAEKLHEALGPEPIPD